MEWALGLEKEQRREDSMEEYEICWLTLDSDVGRGGDGATESGSAGVLSSLRC